MKEETLREIEKNKRTWTIDYHALKVLVSLPDEMHECIVRVVDEQSYDALLAEIRRLKALLGKAEGALEQFNLSDEYIESVGLGLRPGDHTIGWRLDAFRIARQALREIRDSSGGGG